MKFLWKLHTNDDILPIFNKDRDPALCVRLLILIELVCSFVGILEIVLYCIVGLTALQQAFFMGYK